MKTNLEIIVSDLRHTASKLTQAADILDDGSRRKPVASVAAPKRSRMSSAARKRIAFAQRARWAKWKKEQKKAA